jgi:hypothetical protein
MNAYAPYQQKPVITTEFSLDIEIAFASTQGLVIDISLCSQVSSRSMIPPKGSVPLCWLP